MAHGFQAGLTAWSPNWTYGRGHHEKGRNMSQYTSLERSQNYWQSTILHILRYPIAWLGLVVVLASPTLILATNWTVQSNAPAPADLFMQSVVKRDGALGWHQLCPSVRAQLPLATLTRQVEEQRISESRQSLTLTVDSIGSHPRPQGGEIPVHVVTARRPHGWVGLRMYIVYTQTSGCVEDVENH